MSLNPEVLLINAFSNPYDNAIATARTCYSSKIVNPAEVSRDEKSSIQRDTIGKSTYLAGHHTIYQHATFQFAIERISRHCIWSFLHSHPFYNSEQVSQRYVHVSPGNFAIPPLHAKPREIYVHAIQMLMEAYDKLQYMLKDKVEKEYLNIFCSRNLQEKRWQIEIKKKCQETARYVLPLATYAHLYHTISGLTLLRYLRICELFDVPSEQKNLVFKMADQVNQWDPNFLKFAEDTLPLIKTPEFLFYNQFNSDLSYATSDFISEFDSSLGGYSSLLVDYQPRSEICMADAVRGVLGITKKQLGDSEAIDLVMNPAKNCYLSETLNLSSYSKLNRTMNHPHFTFKRKISHTADSQDQRHRTIPASRPILSKHLTKKPDYIVPTLIKSCSVAEEYYSKIMDQLWIEIDKLINSGCDIEHVLYLLPNAFPIRSIESGSLIDYHHKWTKRLCYNSQQEIWKTCLEEVQQIKSMFPDIGRHLYPPCCIRRSSEKNPFCPEGKHFCGVPVWELGLNEFKRII